MADSHPWRHSTSTITEIIIVLLASSLSKAIAACSERQREGARLNVSAPGGPKPEAQDGNELPLHVVLQSFKSQFTDHCYITIPGHMHIAMVDLKCHEGPEKQN